MRSRRIIVASILTLASAIPSYAYNHARRGPTSSLFKHKSSKSTAKPSGPRAIEPQRATEIQEALIKAGYMSGTPSGHWDAESQSAMQKLQAEKGWQTKLTPDSRALILLGLGPQQAQSSDATLTSSVDTSSQSDRSIASAPVAQNGFSLAALNSK
ncbi:hypothetical protein HDF16_002344 [Granulicella aggregans]|uniref:Peptidoglycan binding-like domain-containing protein n=1 Tax=Granulicella aggregans TaxID=474949 RepID=A0A7W7ZD31_9BACT|nr:peptidoglycan-binding domain-containing protein [Granulicella aggregans]MBB5057638.1 hypothetical protein [Granulicella aggregans]